MSVAGAQNPAAELAARTFKILIYSKYLFYCSRYFLIVKLG